MFSYTFFSIDLCGIRGALKLNSQLIIFNGKIKHQPKNYCVLCVVLLANGKNVQN